MTILKPEDARRVIARRDGTSTFATLGEHLRRNGRDMASSSLIGIDFSGMRLKGFDLSGADLSGCNLSGADLSGANLTGTTLVGVSGAASNFDGAVLSGADFTRSELPAASFASAKVIGTNFDDCGLDETVWHSSAFVYREVDNKVEAINNSIRSDGANLRGVSFRRARLRRARFSGPAAFLSKTRDRMLVFASGSEIMTEFYPATLFEIDFRDADLTKAAFGAGNHCDGGMGGVITRALETSGWLSSSRVESQERTAGSPSKCEKCDFTGADLNGADFSHATLSSSMFAGSELINADFSFCTCDSSTQFPSEFRLPASVCRLPPPFSLSKLLRKWFR